MTDPHRSHHAVKYSSEPHIHIVKHDILLKGHAVAQLVEALRYNSEGHWFDS